MLLSCRRASEDLGCWPHCMPCACLSGGCLVADCPTPDARSMRRSCLQVTPRGACDAVCLSRMPLACRLPCGWGRGHVVRHARHGHASTRSSGSVPIERRWMGWCVAPRSTRGMRHSRNWAGGLATRCIADCNSRATRLWWCPFPRHRGAGCVVARTTRTNFRLASPLGCRCRMCAHCTWAASLGRRDWDGENDCCAQVEWCCVRAPRRA